MKILWDGSYIGVYNPDVIIYYNDEGDYPCVVLDLESVQVCGMMVESSSNIHCVLDEMKSLFGISKCGTHCMHIESTMYILYRIDVNDQCRPIRNISVEHDIDDDSIYRDEIFREAVKRAYAFQYIVSSSMKRSRDVIVRSEFVTTIRDGMHRVGDDPTSFWFGSSSILLTIRRMLRMSQVKYDGYHYIVGRLYDPIAERRQEIDNSVDRWILGKIRDETKAICDRIVASNEVREAILVILGRLESDLLGKPW